MKHKDLVGIPWRVAFALQADGWWLRQDIIWHKPNPMPESVRDRCTKAHEYVFLLTKSERYYYDAEAVSEASSQSSAAEWYRTNKVNRVKPPGATTLDGNPNHQSGLESDSARGATRNRRSVWTITTKPYSGAHFAVMPPDLVEPCIKAGTSEEGCCPACGTPWERVREKTGAILSTGGSENNRRNGHTDFGGSDMNCGTFTQHEWKTTGWRPACTCGGSPVPCTVLDPFAGSGTTLAVAAELGRNGIGCELNPEYITLAERRIREARQSNALFDGVPA